MNAVEFVKDNKWLLEDDMIALREIVSESKDYKYFCLNNTLGHSYSNHGGGPALLIDDLKQIVDAFELVEICGGMESCYKKLAVREKFRPKAEYFAIHHEKPHLIQMYARGEPKITPNHSFKKLIEAINLVEQCQ